MGSCGSTQGREPSAQSREQYLEESVRMRLGMPSPVLVHPHGTSGAVMRGASLSGDQLRKESVEWQQEKRCLHHALDDLANSRAGNAFADRALYLQLADPPPPPMSRP